MKEPDYDSVVSRINGIYSVSSPSEQNILKQILLELSQSGYSYTYEQLYLSDFKEVPVNIDTFLDDEYYLGGTNNMGKGVYPYWRYVLNDIFNAGTKYNEIVFSGATRIGKSSTMVTSMAYMLYRLMLYRDPHRYFGKKEVSRFTLAFANLNEKLAYGVAYREFQDTLKDVPWFMDRGRLSRSDRNFYYIPEGDKIDIVAGSDSSMFLGMQIWCLVGSTKIATSEGVKRIEDCADTYQNIIQLIGNNLISTNAKIECTGHVLETILVELEDGSLIEGTPDHRVMLSHGVYAKLSEITLMDEMITLRRVNKASSIASCPVTYSSVRQHLRIKSISPIKHDKAIPVYDVIDVRPNHNFLVVCGDTLIVSHNCAAVDEAAFSKAGVKDIAKAKAHMQNLYNTVNARVSGTFRLGGEVYGKLITCSSKNQDNDFLSDHIEKQLKTNNDHFYLVDEPQWKILPKSMFSNEVFHFTVGDRYKRGFVIPEENDDEAHRAEYERQGYRVIEAPAELRKNFLADYDISLRDIAGISVVGSMGFITQESITPCVSQERQNPFYEDIIVVGVEDTAQIADYFHIENVPNNLKNQKLYIHIDFAESHNRTGIAGVCVSGNKVIENPDGKKVALPYITEVFAVAIEAPRGQKQSYQKVVNFLVFLRQNYFNIGVISTDSFQSSFVRETLNQQGFETNKFSVDMDQFIGLRNLLMDQRIDLIKNVQQETELISVQRMNNKIFIPEDEGGGHGDIATALAGCTYSIVSDQVTVRPPSKNLASIAAAVNSGRGRGPMSSSKTVKLPSGSTNKIPTRFPKLH